MSQFFSLRSKQDVLRCVAYIGSLALIGQRWSVKVEEYKPKRSLAQNRLFHSWIGEWAKSRGENPGRLKILIKDHLGMYQYETNEKTGKVIAAMRSTADLTVDEFSGLILQTEVLAAQQGVILDRNEDYLEAMGIEKDPEKIWIKSPTKTKEESCPATL